MVVIDSFWIIGEIGVNKGGLNSCNFAVRIDDIVGIAYAVGQKNIWTNVTLGSGDIE